MAKIYTRTGDTGETGLVGGGRVRKDSIRVAAYGAVDELNAALGVARAELARTEPSSQLRDLDDLLGRIQHQLFNLGAELATAPGGEPDSCWLGSADTEWLEAEIDRHTESLAALRQFILPGGCPLAAQLHVARCVCRRAELQVVRLAAEESVRPDVMAYVNRLSDLLFTLARFANQVAGVADVAWQQRSEE